ncbi:universal stress protein [Herbidospora sp. NEAU-GS84]|uniref:Universal stress protein n=1 Tax=Herbidospora solisilvae TaxID=2696284 RepID=A0A7C9J6M7_9ACTN|nr:universal stress protein [Herbidospora solisilvae]NAS25986.1 universal stress protein [Herbidospora solisilvae]
MKEAIVVGVDGSPATVAAIEWAADDAARTGLPLRVVFAVDRSPHEIPKFPNPHLEDALSRGAVRVLQEAERAAKARQPGITVVTEQIEGRPADVLRRAATEAAELVVGTRGMGGFAGAVVGSVSSHVAGHVPGPVVVVRHLPGLPTGEIVVGVDDSPAAQPALAYAFEQARSRYSTLRAVRAWMEPVHAYAPGIIYDLEEIGTAQHAVVAGILDPWRERYPEIKVIEDVRLSHPVAALVDASAGADLLVVGSHGRSAVASALMGSVSRAVLHHAECPVAVVRPDAPVEGAENHVR